MSDKDLICSLEETYNSSIEKGFVTLSTTFIEHLLVILKGKQQQKKTGKWVGEKYWLMCSECQCDCPHFIRDWDYKQVRTKYCPNCGAKMKNCE